MPDLDALMARLEAAVAALGDPGDVAAPNERLRLGEQIAHLERCRHSLAAKRRRVATLEGRIADREAELQKWAEVEAAIQAQLDEARDALPGLEDHRDRRKAERSIASLERDLQEVEDGVRVEAGRTICSGTFSRAFESAFGEPGTALARHAPAGELRAQVEALNREADEVRAALAQVVARVESLLSELEAVAA